MVQVTLFKDHTPKNLRERSPNSHFRKNVLITNSTREEIGGDNHMTTVLCGEPLSC